MDDICLCKLGQSGDIRSGIGYIYCKKIVFSEMVGFPDDDTFPHKFPYCQPVAFKANDAYLIGLFVTYQHFRFNPVILQGFHKPAGGHGCPADTFGCINDQYSHVPECFGKSSGFL